VKISSAEHRLITWTFFDEDLKATFNKIVGPDQNGVRTQVEISIKAFGVTAAHNTAPAFCVLQGDLKNRYNEVLHGNIMCALQKA
jgi:hypothetical protein